MKLLRTIEGSLNRLFVFELSDGYLVEGVHYRGDTLCVSTQVGCHVRCGFCASGRNGLIRNLSSDEIKCQYLLVRERFEVRRIAFAGIGEPLANWRNVKEAFFFFKGLGLKVSLYTTGFPLKALNELLELPHNGVSVSVHTFDPSLRKKIMPRAGAIEQLLSFLSRKLPKLSRKRRKKVSLAYLLLKGINDSERDLETLADLAKELGVGVTLLRYNDVGAYETVTDEEYERAFRFLREKGVRVTLSTRFRKDKIGGCGTLTVGKMSDINLKEVPV